MTKHINFKAELYSPKIGEKKLYEFTFTKEQLTIEGTSEVRCSWIDENIDPVWSGSFQKNALIQMLEDEKIYPPSNINKAVELAWRDWIFTRISDKELEAEIKVLINWINIITKTKLGNEYWADKF